MKKLKKSVYELTFMQHFARDFLWKVDCETVIKQCIMSRPSNNDLWVQHATTRLEMKTVRNLRESIYSQAGKVAGKDCYENRFDIEGKTFLIGRGDKWIGTFSICDLSVSKEARDFLSNAWNLQSEDLKKSLYVYFFGIESSERRAYALKIVFSEVFKELVRRKLTDIHVLADARLSRRYRWIGLIPLGPKVLSAFPKSGWLNVLTTRQILAGIYGLHADPLRWNWYLREATAELLREGSMPSPFVSRFIYILYSGFAPVAVVAETLATLLIRRGKEKSQLSIRKFNHVRPL